MAHPGFGHLWQQEETSDVEIVISVAEGKTSAGDEFPEARSSSRTFLQQFPGHSQILSLSPYLLAQALRWATQSQGSSQPGRASNTASSIPKAAKRVHITLPDASGEPAAVAILAGLYQVEPWPKLLVDLTPRQQVQAAVLADMWQLPAASEAAVAALQQTFDKDDDDHSSFFAAYAPHMIQPGAYSLRVSAVINQISLPAVPDSLLPVLERALLSEYGHLDAVWNPEWTCSAVASSQESLLALPLYAMELLLASDKLKVASEDTVLFTARTYVDNLAGAGGDVQQAINTLAPLVRCPHLSQLWLSASVLSDDTPQMLLHALQPQLKRLLQLKLACSPGTTNRSFTVADGRRRLAENIQVWIPAAPASWLLPQRNISNITQRDMYWALDVSAIRQAAQDSASQQSVIQLRSPSSFLLKGVMWCMELECSWDASKQGSTITLSAQAQSLPAGSLCSCTYQLLCYSSIEVRFDGMMPEFGTAFVTDCFFGDHANARGPLDLFELGAMSGGFDEAAWAAKALPSSGTVGLMLTVKDVGV